MNRARLFASLALLGAARLLLSMPAVAQRTTFSPAVALAYFESGDVDATGPASESDAAVRVALELPVTRQLRKGSFRLSYAPAVEEFKDFRNLDNTSHRIDLDVGISPDPVSSFLLRARYVQSIEQADATSAEDPDLFLSRPSDRELAGLDIEYRDRLSGRFRWQMKAGYREAKFSDIEGFATGESFEDRTDFRGSLGVARSLSRLTHVGVEYGYGRAELDLSGSETRQSVSATMEREFSARSSLKLAVGVFESTGSAALGTNGSSTDSRQGVQASFDLQHFRKKVEWGVVGSVRPTSGGARLGTSTNTVVGFLVKERDPRRFGWSSSLRFAERDPSDPEEPEIRSVALGLQTEIRLGRLTSLRFGANYVRQDGDEGGERLEFLSRGGVSLVWYPLAGTRLGGPGSAVGAGRGKRN